MNFANTSLFVGDLPKFCNEVDLEQLFAPFGPILDVKIKRNINTGKTLSYGFVTFASEAAASEGLRRLDGTMFYGRKLRLRWAMYNARSQNPINQGGVINSIYVRFTTSRVDQYITEEELHRVFQPFGNLIDVSIKETSVDPRLNRQSGYGFVHFSCDSDGVEAAFQAVSAIDNATIDGVTYNVELSKNLLKQFNEMRSPEGAAAAGGAGAAAGGALGGGIGGTLTGTAGLGEFYAGSPSGTSTPTGLGPGLGSGLGSGPGSVNGDRLSASIANGTPYGRVPTPPLSRQGSLNGTSSPSLTLSTSPGTTGGLAGLTGSLSGGLSGAYQTIPPSGASPAGAYRGVAMGGSSDFPPTHPLSAHHSAHSSRSASPLLGMQQQAAAAAAAAAATTGGYMRGPSPLRLPPQYPPSSPGIADASIPRLSAAASGNLYARQSPTIDRGAADLYNRSSPGGGLMSGRELPSVPGQGVRSRENSMYQSPQHFRPPAGGGVGSLSSPGAGVGGLGGLGVGGIAASSPLAALSRNSSFGSLSSTGSVYGSATNGAPGSRPGSGTYNPVRGSGAGTPGGAYLGGEDALAVAAAYGRSRYGGVESAGSGLGGIAAGHDATGAFLESQYHPAHLQQPQHLSAASIYQQQQQQLLLLQQQQQQLLAQQGLGSASYDSVGFFTDSAAGSAAAAAANSAIYGGLEDSLHYGGYPMPPQLTQPPHISASASSIPPPPGLGPTASPSAASSGLKGMNPSDFFVSHSAGNSGKFSFNPSNAALDDDPLNAIISDDPADHESSMPAHQLNPHHHRAYAATSSAVLDDIVDSPADANGNSHAADALAASMEQVSLDAASTSTPAGEH